MKKTRGDSIRATRFCWQWPEQLEVAGAEPVSGMVLRLDGGRRFFIPHQDEAWQRVPFHGVMLLVKDKLIPTEHASLFLGMVVISMCYLAGRRPHGVRRVLSGLRGSYREKGSLAESFLGERTEAWQKLFTGAATQGGYSPPRFRRQIGRFLATKSGGMRRVGLPAGIDALFALKGEEPDYNSQLVPIYKAIADCLEKRRKSRGRKASDLQKWMTEFFTHRSDPPLRTDRDTLLWAVAHATHFSWSACHGYGMSRLMMQCDPPLDSAERMLFHYFQTSNALIGVPLWRLPRDFRELLSSVTHESLSGKKQLSDARTEAARILSYHGSLKDDENRQDRERKSATAANARRDMTARQDRGRRRSSRRSE